jgi:hypothetical protein
MKKIPLFIVEEHHEAFLVWNYSVRNKIIQVSNNVLLHVDEHSDMAVTGFNKSIKSINTLEALQDFTYTELTIATFIIPAIYQGIFNHVYWLYQSNDEWQKARKNIVYSQNGEGKILKTEKISERKLLSFYNSSFKSFTFEPITIDRHFLNSKLVVLDIDLDYFSCNHSSYYYKGKLEVTEEEYSSFNKNKYHFLRLSSGSGIRSKLENGKYYLIFKSIHPETMTTKLKVSEEEIIRRIDIFIEFLKKNNLQLQMIDICRSRLSGFTPDDQWEFIENKIIEKLRNLYEIEINHIRDILSNNI